MDFRIENGMWTSELQDKFFQCERMGLIYTKKDTHDQVVCFGEFVKMQEVFLSDQTDRVAKQGHNVRLVEVPQEYFKMLNKCVNISASKWCSQLESEIMNDPLYIDQHLR